MVLAIMSSRNPFKPIRQANTVGTLTLNGKIAFYVEKYNLIIVALANKEILIFASKASSSTQPPYRSSLFYKIYISAFFGIDTRGHIQFRYIQAKDSL